MAAAQAGRKAAPHRGTADGEIRLRCPRPPGPCRRCPLPGAAVPRLGAVQARDHGAPGGHHRAHRHDRGRDRGLHPARAHDHRRRSANRQRARRGGPRHGADQVARSRARAGTASRRRGRGHQSGDGRARDRARTPCRRPPQLALRESARRGAGGNGCGRSGRRGRHGRSGRRGCGGPRAGPDRFPRASGTARSSIAMGTTACRSGSSGSTRCSPPARSTGPSAPTANSPCVAGRSRSSSRRVRSARAAPCGCRSRPAPAATGAARCSRAS